MPRTITVTALILRRGADASPVWQGGLGGAARAAVLPRGPYGTPIQDSPRSAHAEAGAATDPDRVPPRRDGGLIAAGREAPTPAAQLQQTPVATAVCDE